MFIYIYLLIYFISMLKASQNLRVENQSGTFPPEMKLVYNKKPLEKTKKLKNYKEKKDVMEAEQMKKDDYDVDYLLDADMIIRKRWRKVRKRRSAKTKAIRTFWAANVEVCVIVDYKLYKIFLERTGLDHRRTIGDIKRYFAAIIAMVSVFNYHFLWGGRIRLVQSLKKNTEKAVKERF